MPHLSGKEVKEKWLGKIEELLFAMTADAKSARERRHILAELLTDTERLMLGKRLALIAMLEADFSSYTIMKRLGISFATIKRFARVLDRGGYEHVGKEIKRLQSSEAAWETLEKILRGGLPPIAGKEYRPTLLRKRKKRS